MGDKEYAYGGHDRKGVSGVYWTRPLMEPPGATFRCEILHGFALRSEEDIETIIREVRSNQHCDNDPCKLTAALSRPTGFSDRHGISSTTIAIISLRISASN